MNVPDEIRKCVGFVGYQPPGGGPKKLVGTAFFIGRQAGPTPDEGFVYVVTAKHVLDKVRDRNGASVWLRANAKDGTLRWIEMPWSDWFYHESDETVDVAVAHAPLTTDLDHLIYPAAEFTTEDIIGQYGIGVGDEVFITGLFRHHYGDRHNIPIVRIGNIAAMPQETVRTRFGEIEAYLIEARSIGGISGSPVFVHLVGTRRQRPFGRTFNIMGGPPFFLLGLVHAHFDSYRSPVDAMNLTEDVEENDEGPHNINTGIAVVVPSSKILELLDQPAIREKEKRIDEADHKRRSAEK